MSHWPLPLIQPAHRLSSASIGNYFSFEMPLITSQLFKEGVDNQNEREIQEECRSNEGGIHQSLQQHTFSKEQHQDYYSFEEFHDQDEDDDMLTAQNQLTPELPQKSHLRASKIFDNLSLNLPDIGKNNDDGQESLYSNPLDLYLSSEEDGSASGDDYEDVVSDEENGNKSTAVRRQSYEETATVISFKCLKPHLVEINHRHLSPASYALDSLSQRPNSVFSSRSQPLLTTLPPRSSSRPTSSRPPLSLNTSSSTSTNPQIQPSFLSNDPYPNESPNSIRSLTTVPSRPSTSSPQTAKSEKSSTGWNSLRAVSRTFAIARKKVSVPAINLAYNSGAIPQRNSLSPLPSYQASTSSASLFSTETNTPLPISARRRSQTFDRLIRPSSKDERRGSQYSGRYEYGSEEWKALASPAYMLGSSRSENDNSMIPRQQTSPVDISVSPVEEIIPLARRNRSYTTSQASSQSRSTETKTESQQSIPAMPSSSSSALSEEMKQSRRMTTMPDYSRAGKVARERAEQRKSSAGLMSPGNEVVGNTYDIVKSVATGGAEIRKDGGKVVRGKTSMALLGLRRGGVKAWASNPYSINLSLYLPCYMYGERKALYVRWKLRAMGGGVWAGVWFNHIW